MDIVFRRILFNSPRIAPPGELHVRALDAKDDTGLAKLALDGRAGFVGGGDPNPLALVIHDNPTLDDMLAALFLIHRVPRSASADHFARYAESVRRGLSPTRAGGRSAVPVERTLEAVFEILRHNAVEGAVGAKSNYGSLLDAACAARFLSDWRRLGDLILDKIKAAVDPHLQPLFDDNSDFQNELTFLGNDHATYCRERDAGQRFLVQMSNGGPPVPALVVSDRTSYLFVRFARADDQAPDGHKFHLLGIKDPDEGWIISTDPLDRYNLKPLADRLQDAETAATPKGETPNVWRDGAPHKHTIIFPPETGSRLSDDVLIDTIKKWGHAKPAPKRVAAGLLSATPPPRSRWTLALGGAGLAVAISAAIFFFSRPPVPSSSNKSDPTSSDLDERIKVFARGENNEPSVAEKMKLGQRLLPREEQRLHAGSPTDATFVLTNPGGQKRSIQVWLEYANTKEVPVPPPDNVVLRTSAGQSIPVSEWTKPEPVVWKSPEVRQVEIEGDKPTLSLRVSDYKGDDRELGIQLCWRPDYDLHLFFLAVGVSNYNRSAGVHNLACPADDARAMAAAVRKNCRHLFSRIDCPDPVVDPQATRADVIRAIEGMRKRIAADPARLKLAIVFFAGHGVICEPQYFAFLPQDYVKDDTANVISANDIKDRLGVLSCPVLLVLDSCHSGQAALDIFSTTRGSNDSKELEKAVQVFEQQKGGLYVLTACQADELALEDKKVWGHGALCTAMLEILNGVPGVPHSGILTLKDLNDYVGKRVKELIQQATGNSTTVIPAFPPGRLPEAIPIAYFPSSK